MFHVKFRNRSGRLLGLYFRDGISVEVVTDSHDPILRRLRCVYGSGSFSLIPVEQAAAVPPPPPAPPPLPAPAPAAEPEPQPETNTEPATSPPPTVDRLAKARAAKAAKAAAREKATE